MPPKQRARNLGSNYTTFRYAGKNIAYLQVVNDSGQPPVGGRGRYEAVHPLGERHPTELVAPRAISEGTLQLSITEVWHEEVWQQMAGLAGSNDIIDVFEALSRQQNYVTCTKIINPPDGKRYGKTYHRCLIVDIPDGERYDITTLTTTKTLTVAYTHTTRL